MGSKILHLNQWELCSSRVRNFAIVNVYRNEDNGISGEGVDAMPF